MELRLLTAGTPFAGRNCTSRSTRDRIGEP
jgi:hypothetical protein